MLEQTAEGYDGAAPFAGEPDPRTTSRRVARTTSRRVQVAVTAAIAAVPFAGLILALWLVWGHGVGLTDALMMAGLYVITGLGVTAGFHRCFTHRSFSARLQIDLSAGAIRIFERLGWATNVRWPTSSRLDHRRRPEGDRQDPALVPAGLGA